LTKKKSVQLSKFTGQFDHIVTREHFNLISGRC